MSVSNGLESLLPQILSRKRKESGICGYWLWLWRIAGLVLLTFLSALTAFYAVTVGDVIFKHIYIFFFKKIFTALQLVKS